MNCCVCKKKKHKGILVISYLDYPYPSGLSIRIAGLVSILDKNGIRIKILAPASEDCEIVHSNDQRNNPSVERIILKGFGSSNSSRLGPRLLRWLAFSVMASFRVVKIVIKNNYLIQYQSVYSAIPALFAKITLGAEILGDDIVLVHPFIDTMSSTLTDLIITPSIETYSFAKRLGKSVLYVPNGVEQGIPRKSSMDPNPTLLFVGYLNFSQNLAAVENIIEIASILHKKGLKFEVLIIGGPLDYVAHLKNHSVVIEGNVKFLGTVSEKRLRELFSTSFIGLMPFFRDTPLTGGQRTKALAFFANSLLVISGPEGVKGIDGLIPGIHYLRADSIDEMCNIIIDCLSKPEEYYNIAESGEKYIIERYSWENLTRDYVARIKIDVSPTNPK